MCLCAKSGHELVGLANLVPKSAKEEDSYMYQTVGHEFLDLYAEAMALPLFRRTISGKPLNTEMDYNELDGDEVEDLFHLLADIKKEVPFEGISVGAILSTYQKLRVENVCQRLGVEMLAPIWAKEQTQLLKDMIDSQMNAIIVKVAVIGLDATHLSKPIDQMLPILEALNQKYGINVCGEGGEYETITLDCPLFKKKIILDDFEIITHSNDAFAKVSYLRPTKLHLEDKK
ncbi:unnamed protein product [Medioppia subpectinata]|uniref:Diphthine--ammonia ligase n=1 Tax=Medioppia subpectinata TaxID=1979941 RepID=A0A7R9LQV8_9ACAR|nr:unnamed protein product [Medioppia subpectinata]CAG2120905.1 unnamed protein product [Medioppia subpectinata]